VENKGGRGKKPLQLQAIFCHGKKKKKSNERHPEKKGKSKKNQTRKIKKKIYFL